MVRSLSDSKCGVAFWCKIIKKSADAAPFFSKMIQNIAHASGNNAFLYDFAMEIGQLFHLLWAKVIIFAKDVECGDGGYLAPLLLSDKYIDIKIKK